MLALLAEAAEAADRCGGAMAEEKNPAEEARAPELGVTGDPEILGLSTFATFV